MTACLKSSFEGRAGLIPIFSSILFRGKANIYLLYGKYIASEEYELTFILCVSNGTSIIIESDQV